MNRTIQLSMTAAMVAAAGLAAASACPPDEQGSPAPQQQIEREVVKKANGHEVRARLRVVQPQVAGVTLNPEVEDVIVRRVDGPGSTLETRVYKPGEAAQLHGLFAADGAERTLRVKENGRDIRVEQRGGKVTATINGKPVAPDAVTVKDGKVEVRDESGNVVLTEEWGETPGASRTIRRTWTVPTVPGVPGVPAVPGVTWPGNQEEFPKVMMGITMENADADVVEQLGLPEGDYAVITSAPDELPAARAGLQAKDIIVSIDGKAVAGMEAVREAIKEKTPGDVLKVEVMRKGARTTADVKLDAFDTKRFAPLQQTMGQADQWRAFGEQMKAMGEKFGKDAEGNRFNLAIPKNGEPMILMHPDGGVEKLQDRLNQMEAQLQRLEAMLKRLEAKGAIPTPAGGVGDAPKPWIASGV